MNYKNSFAKIVLIAITFLLVACGAQSTSEPVLMPSETLTPIHLTETPTLTPTPEPTSTPTITPTPIGGKSGLLLYQVVCPQDGECVQTIFLYNLVSHELISFLDGYAPLDVSPDGKKVLLKNTRETGDLFIVDLAKPEQIVLLHKDVKDAVWLYETEWIGFIAVQNGIHQVFIIHPDGSDLTQVTKSVVGVVTLESVFNDGVFWGEGTTNIIRKFKWTKLDGTETQFTNFRAISPSGKYVITLSMKLNMDCFGCTLNLIDVSTGETREISLSKPDPNIDFSFPGIQPLSDDKWLIEKFATSTTDRQYWIYSSDGNVLEKLPNDYDMVDESDPPSSYDLLSSDGIWLLVSRFERISDEQFEVTYHLLNILTLEIKDLPNLYYTSTGMKIAGNRRIDGVIVGCRIQKDFWIEIP